MVWSRYAHGVVKVLYAHGAVEIRSLFFVFVFCCVFFLTFIIPHYF